MSVPLTHSQIVEFGSADSFAPSSLDAEISGRAKGLRPDLSILTGNSQYEKFTDRHIGPSPDETAKMLAAIGLGSLDELLEAAIPGSIRLRQPLNLGTARSETEVIAALRDKASRNRVVRSMIGQGYYGTVTPPVIMRNVLESPAWYTAYTPYQPEISQGRLEAMLRFQTMVAELTNMDLAGASLLDDATAAAEAMTLAMRVSTSKSKRFLIDPLLHPQVINVVQTRGLPIGIEVVVAPLTPEAIAADGGCFGVLVAHIGTDGSIRDSSDLVTAAHSVGALLCAHTDLLACVLVEPPGSWGADIVAGSAQRFGVPMFFGGPHAGFLAVHDKHKRALPGRLVGVSVDSKGRQAFRLALQTREQHIRRERATSNICTAQALLAITSAFYAMWHGVEGLARIANRVHAHANTFASSLVGAGFTLSNDSWFDTVTVAVPTPAAADQLVQRALDNNVNLRRVDATHIGIACDETTTHDDVQAVLDAFGSGPGQVAPLNSTQTSEPAGGPKTAATQSPPAPSDANGSSLIAHGQTRLAGISPANRRQGPALRHTVFQGVPSETDMLREIRRLSDRDLALDRTMIPLGSCTMKLNATTEMLSVTWPEFANLHPFSPAEQTVGSRELITELEAMLEEITGYDRVSLQPNAGSQGELAGLLAIRAYHLSRGDSQRTVCLIPSSAHGTNAASATMSGMRVVVVPCDDAGNVDLDDLLAKIAQHRNELGALMVTYPSTHGVFEDRITEICALVHQAGGQVYLDGANFNALVGTAKPGKFGADVSHLNLHKTFCIPHGGGGPGVGPVCVGAHLAPFLPSHPSVDALVDGPGVGAISAAPWGSAGILQIPWAYIALMGPDGLRSATSLAILNANYVAARLGTAYPILYTGSGGRVAHECILDLRPLTNETGITVDDVAKRLMDFGFHAPTMSFPVAGTLMVEPTESESLQELDRFCDAMIEIRREIDQVAAGVWPADNSPLVHAPHTAADLLIEPWDRPYPRLEGAYPDGKHNPDKYWPPVSRIDGVFGDRNVVCSCPPMDSWT
jgi:glycine dehydrogenase